MKKLLFLATAAMMVLFAACNKEESGSNSIEGQWYCYENGGQDVRLYLELKDGKADLIITAWGDRYKGSYSYSGETLSINYSSRQSRYVAGENPDKATSVSNLFNDWPSSTEADHVDLENPITMTFKVDGNKAVCDFVGLQMQMERKK